MSIPMHDLRRAAIVPLLLTGSACLAEPPGDPAGGDGLNAPCSNFADQLIAYNLPDTEGSSPEGERALGMPDSVSVDIATNATLTLGFFGLGGLPDSFDPTTGARVPDLLVHGSAAPGSEVAVYLGFGDGTLEYSGPLEPETLQIDLSTARERTMTYLQLVGLSGTVSVDAVESLVVRCM